MSELLAVVFADFLAHRRIGFHVALGLLPQNGHVALARAWPQANREGNRVFGEVPVATAR